MPGRLGNLQFPYDSIVSSPDIEHSMPGSFLSGLVSYHPFLKVPRGRFAVSQFRRRRSPVRLGVEFTGVLSLFDDYPRGIATDPQPVSVALSGLIICR